MDFEIILTSLGVSITTAGSLAWLLIKHNMKKDFEKYKTQQETSLEEAKASWERQLQIDTLELQDRIHSKVEEYLGDRSAEREYILDARKRLYQSIGPLRFQLLLACRDVATRVNNYGSDQHYDMTVRGYCGRSTLFRLLRPLAISELIEREITYTDFSVDPSATDLLRFKKAAFTAFTDGDTILDHPDADWSAQKQHLFSGTLSRLASSLIVDDENVPSKLRPMHFHEFESLVRAADDLKRYFPLTEILDRFEISEKPLFWIRIVCFGFICSEYVGKAGTQIGFAKPSFNLAHMISIVKDPYIRTNAEKFPGVFEKILSTTL